MAPKVGAAHRLRAPTFDGFPVRGHRAGTRLNLVPQPVPVAPEVRDLSRRLLPEAESLGHRMAERIMAEVPYYADGQVVAFDQVAASCTDNVRYVLSRLADIDASADTPRVTGSTRAVQGMPYSAVLQAFRVGGRFIWELMVEHADPQDRDVLLLAAADIWAVSDDLADQVTQAYRSTVADRARHDLLVRSAHVATLLDGDARGTEEFWEAAAVLSLQRSGQFVVVSGHCPSPGAEALPDMERVLRRHNVGSAWRIDHDHHDGVVALRFGFGAERLAEVIGTVAVSRTGVSSLFERLEDAPDARRQARVACAAAAPGTQETVWYAEHPLAVLLASSPEQAEALARAVLGPVLALPTDDRRLVLDTARTWLASAGATSTAARELHVHRNTVRYRLRRLEELTGRDLAHPVDAAQVHVALECVRILGLEAPDAPTTV